MSRPKNPITPVLLKLKKLQAKSLKLHAEMDALIQSLSPSSEAKKPVVAKAAPKGKKVAPKAVKKVAPKAIKKAAPIMAKNVPTKKPVATKVTAKKLSTTKKTKSSKK